MNIFLIHVWPTATGPFSPSTITAHIGTRDEAEAIVADIVATIDGESTSRITEVTS